MSLQSLIVRFLSYVLALDTFFFFTRLLIYSALLIHFKEGGMLMLFGIAMTLEWFPSCLTRPGVSLLLGSEMLRQAAWCQTREVRKQDLYKSEIQNTFMKMFLFCITTT